MERTTGLSIHKACYVLFDRHNILDIVKAKGFLQIF